MKKHKSDFAGLVAIISHKMDSIAGFCITGVMVLVVLNIILRKFFKQPIVGAYELVGYLTAIAISLALARCALDKGHIALDFIINKCPQKLRAVINLLINLTGLVFWSLCAWSLALYAMDLMDKGVVSTTAHLPLFPFVLFIAFALVILSLVSLVQLCEESRALLASLSSLKFGARPDTVEYARKATR